MPHPFRISAKRAFDQTVDEAAEYVASLPIGAVKHLVADVKFKSKGCTDALLADYFELALCGQSLAVQKRTVDQVKHHRTHGKWLTSDAIDHSPDPWSDCITISSESSAESSHSLDDVDMHDAPLTSDSNTDVWIDIDEAAPSQTRKRKGLPYDLESPWRKVPEQLDQIDISGDIITPMSSPLPAKDSAYWTAQTRTGLVQDGEDVHSRASTPCPVRGFSGPWSDLSGGFIPASGERTEGSTTSDAAAMELDDREEVFFAEDSRPYTENASPSPRSRSRSSRPGEERSDHVRTACPAGALPIRTLLEHPNLAQANKVIGTSSVEGDIRHRRCRHSPEFTRFGSFMMGIAERGRPSEPRKAKRVRISTNDSPPGALERASSLSSEGLRLLLEEEEANAIARSRRFTWTDDISERDEDDGLFVSPEPEGSPQYVKPHKEHRASGVRATSPIVVDDERSLGDVEESEEEEAMPDYDLSILEDVSPITPRGADCLNEENSAEHDATSDGQDGPARPTLSQAQPPGNDSSTTKLPPRKPASIFRRPTLPGAPPTPSPSTPMDSETTPSTPLREFTDSPVFGGDISFAAFGAQMVQAIAGTRIMHNQVIEYLKGRQEKDSEQERVVASLLVTVKRQQREIDALKNEPRRGR